MAVYEPSASNVCLVHHLLRARDWQDRPQLQEVCRWWRDVGVGVCGLVGIGGAGKTAVADRFLRLLPGLMAQAADLPQDPSLPVPEGLLVFSFYDAPNPELFFDALYDWLVRAFGVPDRRRATEDGQRLQAPATLAIEALRGLAGIRLLLVLDGLEKVQDNGSRSGRFGHIEDGGLRELFLSAARGSLPAVSVLTTTRFVPDDLEYERECGAAEWYSAIGVEQMSEPACVALLRKRGVRGGDDALHDVARQCGLHALTVDLAATYLVRFCEGDPRAPLQMPTAEELAQLAARSGDRRLRYVAEQSARFAKLAQRYHTALSQSDPAALALLQRICLFRLGATGDTLATIFTGQGKEEISGAELARLSRDQFEAKLNLLIEMRLIERTAQPADKVQTQAPQSEIRNLKSEIFSVHPAVRDGFLADLDPDAARRSHEAAREGLNASLGERPGSNPSDPATLDLLEEIVYHAIQSGHVQEAWDVYRNRIGGYKNLGWRLGAYERGERICRAFAGGQPPESAPLPDGLSENAQAVFINEWALYLKNLGRLAAAAGCYQRDVESSLRRVDFVNACIGNESLADVWLLAGRLTSALRAAEEALRLAERADDARERFLSYGYRAHARALQGQPDAALADFRDALHWQHEDDGKRDRPLYSLCGIYHTVLLARLGRSEKATRLTHANIQICEKDWSDRNQFGPACNLVLADLARQRGDLSAAGELLHQTHDWALARDAKEPLCWAELVRARLELSAFDNQPSGADAETHLGRAVRAIEDGLRIARECGFGIFHIDLLLERARWNLLRGDATGAEADARAALLDGHHPPPDSGLPTLLAATDAECNYAWGIAAGRHLLAESLLLKAAQSLGSKTYKPRSRKIPPEVRESVKSARMELQNCIRLRKRIQDPKIQHTDTVLSQLEGALLTEYPLAPPTPSSPPSPADSVTEASSTMTKAPPFDVFLSHNSKDKPTVRRLAEALKQRGLNVWLDEWELIPGRLWQNALEEIIRSAKSAAVLVGKDGLGPWEEPEMLACLSRFVKRGLPVIPVLLPGADAQPELPLFLKTFAWVDLRKGLAAEALDRLTWGVTGDRPGVLTKGKRPPRLTLTHKNLPGEYLKLKYSRLRALPRKRFDSIATGVRQLVGPLVEPLLTKHGCAAAFVCGTQVKLFDSIDDLPSPDERADIAAAEDHLPLVLTRGARFTVELTSP